LLEYPVKPKILAFLKSSENFLDNPWIRVRDNQQERLKYMMKPNINVKPEIGYYLAGFTDGEGSFNVSLRQRPDHTMGWQVVLSFCVSQKESYILSQFKKHLGCGRITQRSRDGLFMYQVNNPTALQEKVIPFFRKYNFLSQNKKYNFSVFCQIAKLVWEKEHLNTDGLKRIIELREKLNPGHGRTRKYNQADVLLKEYPQRLHAKPRAFRLEK